MLLTGFKSHMANLNVHNSLSSDHDHDHCLSQDVALLP